MHNFLNKCKKPAAIHYLLYHISTPNATAFGRIFLGRWVRCALCKRLANLGEKAHNFGNDFLNKDIENFEIM